MKNLFGFTLDPTFHIRFPGARFCIIFTLHQKYVRQMLSTFSILVEDSKNQTWFVPCMCEAEPLERDHFFEKLTKRL